MRDVYENIGLGKKVNLSVNHSLAGHKDTFRGISTHTPLYYGGCLQGDMHIFYVDTYNGSDVLMVPTHAILAMRFTE